MTDEEYAWDNIAVLFGGCVGVGVEEGCWGPRMRRVEEKSQQCEVFAYIWRASFDNWMQFDSGGQKGEFDIIDHELKWGGQNADDDNNKYVCFW